MVQDVSQLTFELIRKSLDASFERSRVIAHNFSNTNTPGYKAFKVIFEDKLASSLKGEGIALTTSNPRHIDDGNSLPNITYDIKKDTSSSMRLDGNNVDPDKEAGNMAANTIMYYMLSSQANTRLAMRKSVIMGR